MSYLLHLLCCLLSLFFFLPPVLGVIVRKEAGCLGTCEIQLLSDHHCSQEDFDAAFDDVYRQIKGLQRVASEENITILAEESIVETDDILGQIKYLKYAETSDYRNIENRVPFLMAMRLLKGKASAHEDYSEITLQRLTDFYVREMQRLCCLYGKDSCLIALARKIGITQKVGMHIQDVDQISFDSPLIQLLHHYDAEKLVYSLYDFSKILIDLHAVYHCYNEAMQGRHKVLLCMGADHINQVKDYLCDLQEIIHMPVPAYQENVA